MYDQFGRYGHLTREQCERIREYIRTHDVYGYAPLAQRESDIVTDDDVVQFIDSMNLTGDETTEEISLMLDAVLQIGVAEYL